MVNHSAWSMWHEVHVRRVKMSFTLTITSLQSANYLTYSAWWCKMRHLGVCRHSSSIVFRSAIFSVVVNVCDIGHGNVWCNTCRCLGSFPTYVIRDTERRERLIRRCFTSSLTSVTLDAVRCKRAICRFWMWSRTLASLWCLLVLKSQPN